MGGENKNKDEFNAVALKLYFWPSLELECSEPASGLNLGCISVVIKLKWLLTCLFIHPCVATGFITTG